MTKQRRAQVARMRAAAGVLRTPTHTALADAVCAYLDASQLVLQGFVLQGLAAGMLMLMISPFIAGVVAVGGAVVSMHGLHQRRTAFRRAHVLYQALPAVPR